MFPPVSLSDHVPSHCCDLKREPASKRMGFYLMVQHAVYWPQGICKTKNLSTSLCKKVSFHSSWNCTNVDFKHQLHASGCYIFALQMTANSFWAWRGRQNDLLTVPPTGQCLEPTKGNFLLYSVYAVRSQINVRKCKPCDLGIWPTGRRPTQSRVPETVLPGKESPSE